MADKKISELTAATSINASDSLPMVQSGATVKVDVQTLVKNLPVAPVITEGAATVETVAGGAVGAPVALSTTIRTSKVTAVTTNGYYTLAAGSNGYTKEIICETWTSSTAVVTVTNGAGFTTITFPTQVGGSATLKYINSKWYVMSVGGKVPPTVA